jgi:diguanylate cyclase (GGDEF)-like protein/PAS domain S-box-containing protein
MSVPPAPTSRLLNWFAAPVGVIMLFVLATSSCILGLVIWKAVDAQNIELTRSEVDTRNLVHSLVQHAVNTIQAVDVALDDIAESLKYRDPPPDLFHLHLMATVRKLPQLRELEVLDADGNWKYSSLPEKPQYNNSDRDYFIYHRDNSDPSIRINQPLVSRLTGRPTVILSKRITDQDGSFAGVLLADIDSAYFNDFYDAIRLGRNGGITLLRTDGIVLAHRPMEDVGRDLSNSSLVRVQLKQNSIGYFKEKSPFDGVMKYFGYERVPQYPIVIVVALSADELFANWRGELRSDLVVAAGLICAIVLMAALLVSQSRVRMKMETNLREREKRYRLLADNIADIILLFDRDGAILFASQSVHPLLGMSAESLVGRSCFDLIHRDDVGVVRAASEQLVDRMTSKTVIFRTCRQDGSIIWLESNLKIASAADSAGEIQVVSVLRDVTQRKLMEDELTALNTRLAQLATTDGLTGLSNRRTFDGFLRREYARHEQISVLLFDIDNFKGFNDTLGHQAGDKCLVDVAKILADVTQGTGGLSARYGGEEFIIVLPGVPEEHARRIADAVRLMIRSLQIVNPAAKSGYVSVSVGIASKLKTTLNELNLVGEADLALYEAKRRGRDQCVSGSSLKSEYREAALAPYT